MVLTLVRVLIAATTLMSPEYNKGTRVYDSIVAILQQYSNKPAVDADDADDSEPSWDDYKDALLKGEGESTVALCFSAHVHA